MSSTENNANGGADRAKRRDGSTAQGHAEPPAGLAQRLREFSDSVKGLNVPDAEPVTETLAKWLAAQYVAAAQRALTESGGEAVAWPTLRNLAADVVALRRGDHSAERLKIEWAQLELDRERSGARLEKLFWEWAQRPENQSGLGDREVLAEEKLARLREIFGVASGLWGAGEGRASAPSGSADGSTRDGGSDPTRSD